MANKNTLRINITLPTELHVAARRLADERGQSVSYLMREALGVYLARSKVFVERVHPKWGGGRWAKDRD